MKTPLLLLLALCGSTVLRAAVADTLWVKQPQTPILLERQDNVLLYLKLTPRHATTLEQVTLLFSEDTDMSAIRSVKLYYGGTEAPQAVQADRFAPVAYLSFTEPGRTLVANPSYSILKAQADAPGRRVSLRGNQKLFPGVNYFWVSIQMQPHASLLSKLSVRVESAAGDDGKLVVQAVSSPGMVRNIGVGVRHAGDDGLAAYRIPGLVTTKAGTLLAVYDVRHNSSVDLQEHVDVGLSRSTDGGRTWEPMRLPLSFGEYGGLPAAQNGVGDASILVDHETGTVWIAALWTHGMGNKRAWVTSRPGLDETLTGQLVLTHSTDDGRTWSAPRNVTRQVKDSSWHLMLQGPGRGTVMHDGTLVFPVQYIDSTRMPHAGIMYSRDKGRTWHMHRGARSNTTEAQVVELSPGTLMLNMRDNRRGSRAVCTTTDMGRTWSEHPTSRKALREPVCMASLIKVKAEDNVLGRDLLLFSNPDTVKGRSRLTIKASLDDGMTWPPQCQLLLDEDEGWGYSCLTMIDRETVGILYESSAAQITFQTIRLTDIVRE